MVSWMAADSDPESYGELISFEFGAGNVKGPGQAAVVMHADPDVSRETSLLDQRGSNVIYGDLLVIPIGQSFVYVQPLYLESEQEETSIPEMKRVVVLNGDNVVMANTLAEAMAAVVGAEPVPEEPGEEPTEEPQGEQTVATLLAEAQAHIDAANAALAAGQLGTYQSEIDAATALIQEACGLTPGCAPAETEASPEPAAQG